MRLRGIFALIGQLSPGWCGLAAIPLFAAAPAGASSIDVPANTSLSESAFTIQDSEQLYVHGGAAGSGHYTLTSSGLGTVEAGGEIYLEPDPTHPGLFTNDGRVELSGTLWGGGRFTNNGTLEINDTSVIDVSIESAGDIAIVGGVGGNIGAGWSIQSGGTFHVASGAAFGLGYTPGRPNPFLDIDPGGAGTNDGSVVVGNRGTLTVQPGGSFDNVAGATIDIDDIGGSPVLLHSQSTAFTNDGAIAIHGGRVLIDPGASITGGGSYQSYGGTTRVGGTLSQAFVNFPYGELEGTGTVSASGDWVRIGADARIAPGNSVGTLTVDGTLEIAGTWRTEFSAAPANDLLVVTDELLLGGEDYPDILLHFYYVPDDVSVFEIAHAGSIPYVAGNVDVTMPAPGRDVQLLRFVDYRGSTDVLFAVVPEPPAVPALTACALLLAGLRTTRRARGTCTPGAPARSA
jgi:hypothetical protein